MNDTDRENVTHPRLREPRRCGTSSALALMMTGSGGDFLCAPLLWFAAVGFATIAAAFAVSGGNS